MTSTATTAWCSTGTAPIADYVRSLRSIELDAAPVEGVRQIDLHGRRRARRRERPFVVSVNLTPPGAEFGDPGDDILHRRAVVNDAIAGRRGDDQLFGLSGNDVLVDGGHCGNDILEPAATATTC